MPNAQEGMPPKSPAVTAKDFVNFVRDQATAERSKLVRAALADPDSELNGWLKGVEEWASEALPISRDPATGREVRQTHTFEKLNALLEFVQLKHEAKLIDDKDFTQIMAAGGLDRIEQFPRTPAHAIAATGRMTATINELHPELASEIAQLNAARSR